MNSKANEVKKETLSKEDLKRIKGGHRKEKTGVNPKTGSKKEEE